METWCDEKAVPSDRRPIINPKRMNSQKEVAKIAQNGLLHSAELASNYNSIQCILSNIAQIFIQISKAILVLIEILYLAFGFITSAKRYVDKRIYLPSLSATG